jgi:hypothetical protein
LKKEPHNRMAAMQQLNMLLIKGKQQAALDLSNSQIPNYSWYIDLYEKSMSLNIELASQAREKNNTQDVNKRLDSVLVAYNEFLLRIESLKSLPPGQLQGRPFT